MLTSNWNPPLADFNPYADCASSLPGKRLDNELYRAILHNLSRNPISPALLSPQALLNSFGAISAPVPTENCLSPLKMELTGHTAALPTDIQKESLAVPPDVFNPQSINSTTLLMAIRQVLELCLPQYHALKLQGQLEISFTPNNRHKAPGSILLEFNDNDHFDLVNNQSEPCPRIDEKEQGTHNFSSNSHVRKTNPRRNGLSGKNSVDPAKCTPADQFEIFGFHPLAPNATDSPNTHSGMYSAPTSPSLDSEVLDLSLNGSVAGSAPNTPYKISSPFEVASNVINGENSTFNQAVLQQLRLAWSKVSMINDYWKASHHSIVDSTATDLAEHSSAFESISQTSAMIDRETGELPRKRLLSGTERTHYIRHHISSNKCFPCNQCHEGFPSLYTLEKHTMVQHGTYRCHVCSARFTQRSNLQRHALKHVGFKPFECRVCSKAYYRKDHLMRHMEMGHPGCAPKDNIIVHLSSSESLNFLDRSRPLTDTTQQDVEMNAEVLNPTDQSDVKPHLHSPDLANDDRPSSVDRPYHNHPHCGTGEFDDGAPV